MKRLLVVLAVLALAAPSSSALAKGNKGHGKGHGNGQAKGKGKPEKVKVEKGNGDTAVVVRNDGSRRVVFVDNDRVAYRNWWRSTYGANCPPGLARKDNGCLPPGLATRRYAVGQRLPTTVVIGKVPSGLRLSVAPAGYRYAYVDGDLLLVDTTSRLIADVIFNALN